MGKKNESRIVIDLLESHAEVPSSEAFRERYVSQYAGRPLGRPAFVASEPEPEPVPEPEVLSGLVDEPVVEATTLIDAFQDGSAIPVEDASDEPFVSEDAGADVVTEDATRLIDALVDPTDASSSDGSEPLPEAMSETTSFEAVKDPEDVWGTPAAEPAPSAEGHGTMIMGALPGDDGQDAPSETDEGTPGGDAAPPSDDSQTGRKKKKRRHR